MKLSPRHSTVILAALAVLALGGVASSSPSFAADPPPAVKPAPPADTKATPIRFTLQLLRVDDVQAFVNLDRPTNPEALKFALISPSLVAFSKGTAQDYLVKNMLPKPFGERLVVVDTKNQKIVASPIMTTLDNSTATISVAGDDLSYTLSLSPNIAANGKILTLWNLRLSGKSLPGATAVTATGATKIDAGKPAVIAEVSLTDPANGHRATFILQGTTLTGDAATDTPPPVVPAPAPITPPTVAPATR